MAVRALFAGVVSGAASALALRLLLDVPPGGRDLWDRTNHAGETVSCWRARRSSRGRRWPPSRPGPDHSSRRSVPALGALDDLAGDSRSKGLTGHLGALARGEVTTGAVKVLGLGVTGVLASALIDSRGRAGTVSRRPSTPWWVAR